MMKGMNRKEMKTGNEERSFRKACMTTCQISGRVELLRSMDINSITRSVKKEKRSDSE
jgi:hypothetical protein